MSPQEILTLTAHALLLVLILSMPPIIVATLVGTLISLVQALTQIQEQTISFGFKLVALVITIFVTARWMGMELYNFTILIFDRFSAM
ncbi:MAG: type III secretion system export apparatus subunit SctS [Pseudomonadota bacterium]